MSHRSGSFCFPPCPSICRSGRYGAEPHEFLPHFAAEYKAPGALSRPRSVACQKSVFDKLSNETRFTGLSFEKAAARGSARRARLRRTLRTFASRAVFSPTYTPPEKMISIFFAPAGANSARLFRQSERRTRGAFCTFSGRLPDLSLRGSAGAVAISQDWLEHRKAPADS